MYYLAGTVRLERTNHCINSAKLYQLSYVPVSLYQYVKYLFCVSKVNLLD